MSLFFLFIIIIISNLVFSWSFDFYRESEFLLDNLVGKFLSDGYSSELPDHGKTWISIN